MYGFFNFQFYFSDNGGPSNELETIQERYTSCLKTYVEHTFPMQPNRLQDLLHRLPEVKYYYIHPFYSDEKKYFMLYCINEIRNLC